MDKKGKTVLLLLGLYILIFWIGFKSGTIYTRMRRKVQAEVVTIPVTSQGTYSTYYIVRETKNGGGIVMDYTQASDTDVIMKIYNNEKLRPILKDANIRIYNEDGDRLY